MMEDTETTDIGLYMIHSRPHSCDRQIFVETRVLAWSTRHSHAIARPESNSSRNDVICVCFEAIHCVPQGD